MPCALGALGLLLGGCEEPLPGPTVDLGPRDQSVVDAGRDLGSSGDAGDVDAGPTECEPEDPQVLGSDPGSVAQRVALTSRGSDFALVFREKRTTFDDLWVRVYRETPHGVIASADLPITTDAGGGGVSSVSRDPTLVAQAGGYLAAWVDSREHGFEIWTRGVSAEGVPAASLARVTTSAGAAASPALARASDGALVLGHVDDDTLAGTTREWLVAGLASTGELGSAWMRVSDAGERTSQGVVVAGASEGFLAGWIDSAGNARVRPLASSGSPVGVALTHGPAAALALHAHALIVARDDGYDALWIQPLATGGSAGGLVRSALPSDSEGRDPGVAPLSGGVVVAYRHLGADGTRIALALVNSRGELARTQLLGPTTSSGGPVSVAVNAEGHIRLAWAEIEGGVTTTYTQALVCAEAP